MLSNKRTHQQSNRATKRKTKRQNIGAKYTLYVTNLNSKIKPVKMKENLYILFSSFADVLEIHYPRKDRRGQGWIVVSSPEEAAQCIEKLDNFQMFENQIHVNLARKDANIIGELTKLESHDKEDEDED